MDNTLQIILGLFDRKLPSSKIMSRPQPLMAPSTAPQTTSLSQSVENTQSPAGLRRNPPRIARPVMIIDSDDSDSEDLEKPAKKRSLRSPRPFRFLDLPAELRNLVYEYLLINNRCKNDPIFSAPKIKKSMRKREAVNKRRETLSRKREEQGKKPIQFRPQTMEPLAYISILSTCTQIHDEAKDILYRKNSFHIVIGQFKWGENLQLHCGIYGWDFPRITNLQLELSLGYDVSLATRVHWISLAKAMPALRRLQIFVTFPDPWRRGKRELNDWKQVDWKYKAIFRDLVAAIPKSVNVKWGLTLKQKVRGYGHIDYAEGKVLRTMYREFENQRGIDLETPVVDPNADYSGISDDD